MKKILLAAALGLGVVMFTMIGNVGHATIPTGISMIDTIPKDTTVPDTPSTPDAPQPDAPQPDTASTPSY